MALAYDNSASSAAAANTSLTYSHTTAGSNRILVVGVALEITGAITVTSVTYAGVPMSFIRARSNTSAAPDKRVELFWLPNPATGANDVVVTTSATADIQAGSISLTGAMLTGQPDASNDAIGASTAPSVAVVTIEDNDWVIDVQTGEGTTNTAGAGQTERWSQTTGGFESSGSHEGPKTPAGSVTMSWSTSDDDEWAIAAAAFAPDTGGLSNPGSLVIGTDINNLTSYTTGAFNTVSGWLYLIPYYTRLAAGTALPVTSVTVSSGETVNILSDFAVTGVQGGGFAWFVATGTNTGVTATFDFNSVSQASFGYNVINMYGQDASPIGLTATATTSAATNHDISLASAPAATSKVVGLFVANTGAVGAVAVEAGTGREIAEAANAETNYIGTQYRKSQELKWDTTAGLNGKLVAVEIKEAGGSATIVSNDTALALTIDNTTITQNHVIAPQDIALALTVDNDTITQNHVVASDDITLGLTEDNATIIENNVLGTQDIALALSEDNTTVTETNFNLVSQDISLALTEDSTTISQNHILASDDIALALTEDNTTIVETNNLTVQDIALGLTTDSTTIDQTNFVLTVQDIVHALTIDNTTITQNHIVASEDIALGLTEDVTTINQNHILPLDDIFLGLTEDNTTIDQTNFVLTAQDVLLSLTEDNTTIAQNHILTAQDLLLALTEDEANITQNHIIVAQDILLSLLLDNTDLEVITNNLIVDDLSLGLSMDNTTITQVHTIVAQDIALTLRLDNGKVVVFVAARPYYIDTNGNIYWVLSQEIGLVEKI